MKIQSLKLVYFSPTKTTKKVIKGIAAGFGNVHIEEIDITRPETRKQSLITTENEVLIVGVPVYMGRVPLPASKWLQTIEAGNTPAVSVVVYGNRAYEDALLELQNILENSGCKAIAGAAYIGEHSFHSADLPAASEGRPDSDDLSHAKSFGCEIVKKLKTESTTQMPDFIVPGNYPYDGTTKLWDVDFIEVNNSCTNCGICSKGCPMGAINSENSHLIDIEKCILCCACIKNCPKQAKSIKPGLMKDAAKRVNTLFQDRKEPELFI